MWHYTVNSLLKVRDHRDFCQIFVNKFVAIALKQLEADPVVRSLKPSLRRKLVKPLIGL